MPQVKVKREDIINVSLKILKTEPFENLTARRIAKELNCSVQPIFHNFINMDDLKKECLDNIYNLYKEYMRNGAKEEKSYKGMGLAYIKFAKDYPNYFKFLFMSESNLTPDKYILDSDGDEVIKEGMKFTGFSYEEQKDFHVKVWIFTHGIATLVASNTVKLTWDEIDDLLGNTVREMLKGRN